MDHTPTSDTAKAVDAYATAQQRRDEAQGLIHLADEILTKRLTLHDSNPDHRCVIAVAGKYREAANAMLEAADAWTALGDDYAAHADGTYQPLSAS